MIQQKVKMLASRGRRIGVSARLLWCFVKLVFKIKLKIKTNKKFF